MAEKHKQNPIVGHCKHGFPKTNPVKYRDCRCMSFVTKTSSSNNLKRAGKCLCPQSGVKNVSSDSSVRLNNSRHEKVPSKNKKQDSCISLDPARLKQLEADLNAIKDQLLILTKNKNIALQATQELRCRYDCLLQRSAKQERQIKELKCVNQGLRQKIHKNTSKDSNAQTSRPNLCNCVSSGHTGSEKQRINEMLKSLQQSQENEKRFEKENLKLKEAVSSLKKQLELALAELNRLQCETAIKTKQQEEILQSSKACMEQLKEKCRQVCELTGTVNRIKTELCLCNGRSDEVETKYQKLMVQHKQLELKLRISEEHAVKRLKDLQMMKSEERRLVEELLKLKQRADQMSGTSIGNQNSTLCERIDQAVVTDESCAIGASSCCCEPETPTTNQKQTANYQFTGMGTTQDKNSQCCCDSSFPSTSKQAPQSCGQQQTTNAGFCDLNEDLQDLVRECIYQKIDNTVGMGQDHCESKCNAPGCLQCVLVVKENELIKIKGELNTLHQRLSGILVQNQGAQNNAVSKCMDACTKTNSQWNTTRGCCPDYDPDDYELECECESVPDLTY